MDIFAHGLWSYAIFNKKDYRWRAVLFGVLPDILSFGIFMVMNLAAGNLSRGPPQLSRIPEWLFSAYNLTHSLVIFILVFGMAYAITRKFQWFMTAWMLHIITDFPTHTTRFFPTPVLWPISHYAYNGISWATGWLMMLNYSALIVVFSIIYWNKSKKRK